MQLSNIANVVDLEYDQGRIIEIGFTTLDIGSRKIIQTYSFPLKQSPYFKLSPAFIALTGLTDAKLRKQGYYPDHVQNLLEKYGFNNRLLIADTSDEITLLDKWKSDLWSPHRLNVSILFALKTGLQINLGLDKMLGHFGLEFQGIPHRAGDDSLNIARLFLEVIK